MGLAKEELKVAASKGIQESHQIIKNDFCLVHKGQKKLLNPCVNHEPCVLLHNSGSQINTILYKAINQLYLQNNVDLQFESKTKTNKGKSHTSMNHLHIGT